MCPVTKKRSHKDNDTCRNVHRTCVEERDSPNNKAFTKVLDFNINDDLKKILL